MRISGRAPVNPGTVLLLLPVSPSCSLAPLLPCVWTSTLPSAAPVERPYGMAVEEVVSINLSM